MSGTSTIEWTEATWNPVTGCTHVSEGCDNCYAARETSGRLKHHPAYQGLAVGGKFTGEIRLLPDRLEEPLRWRRPRMVFVNSMSDLFHNDVPADFVVRVFAVMGLAPRHIFQILTKRPGRMASMLSDPEFGHQVYLVASEIVGERGDTREDNAAIIDNILHHEMETMRDFLPNVWLGTSVENQKWADVRIPKLLETPAFVRFLSCEPLLGPVDLSAYMGDDDPLLDWIIVGGESGPGARPMHPDWARSLRDQADADVAAFFFKQWGEWGREGSDLASADAVAVDGRHWPWVNLAAYVDADVQADPGSARLAVMYRVGKKAAGRELDGRTWDEMPNVPDDINEPGHVRPMHRHVFSYPRAHAHPRGEVRHRHHRLGNRGAA